MRKIVFTLFIITTLAFLSCSDPGKREMGDSNYQADVIVYGGTSAAVIAAVQVKRMGKSVIVVSPDRHLGGLSSGGLGWTDTGNKEVIGGLSREFYHRVFLHYEKPDSWPWQPGKNMVMSARVPLPSMETPGQCGYLSHM